MPPAPPQDGNEADNDTEGGRSSFELPLHANGNAINPELFPLPPSRPPSTAPSSEKSPRTSVKRKKSRTQIVLDEDEESDGAEADAEYGYGNRGGSMGSQWVNIDGRRKVAPGGEKKITASSEEARRHSMVV